MALNPFLLDAARVRDIAGEVLDDTGRLCVLPAAYWATTTPQERALFGHRHGLYSFPTVELVEHLRGLIGGRVAIEIGAGHGLLAQALDIPATDSRQQEKPRYRQMYALMGQPTVPYGTNVVELSARDAVRRYRPEVVIGCWVTHKYDPKRHGAGGNEAGVKEEDILANCDTYVAIGNDQVHTGKKIWSRPHTIEHPPYVYSRSCNGSPDFVATWPGGRHWARSQQQGPAR